MKHAMIVSAVIAVLLSWAQPAPAQDLAEQVVGVWKWKSHVVKEVATGKLTHTLGEKPVGLITYTKGGRLVFFVAGENRKAPASATVTDAERIELFKTMTAGSGTYRVEGNSLFATYDASWIQSWTGTTQKREISIVGNTLVVTASYKNQAGQDALFIVTYERVE